MATLQKIPPLIDRFAMDDKLNMLADGVNTTWSKASDRISTRP